MFSDNHKISSRQLQALLLTDWMGKLALLLPGITNDTGLFAMLAGTLLGLLLAAAFLRLVFGVCESCTTDWFSSVKERLGTPSAVLFYLVYGIYFLFHTALVLFLCEEIAAAYLLPETSPVVLLILPALCAWYLARGGLEVRARVSELTAWILWGIFFLMLFLAAPGVSPRLLRESVGTFRTGEVVSSGCMTAAGFGVIGALPLALQGVQKEHSLRRNVYRAVWMSGILLFLIYIAGFGIFGGSGMARLRWPAVMLMSCSNLQGVFLQRWDILVIALLLTSLFLSAGSGVYYESVIADRLGLKRNVSCILFTAAALLGAFCMIRAQDALLLYREVTFGFCVPAMLLLMMILALAEWKKRRREKHGQKE